MSSESVNEILSRVQALPLKERKKFAAHKARFKKTKTESEAVIEAALKMGLTPNLAPNAPIYTEKRVSGVDLYLPVTIDKNVNETEEFSMTSFVEKVLATPHVSEPVYFGVSPTPSNVSATLSGVMPEIKTLPVKQSKDSWLEFFICAVWAITCTSALVYLGAEARGFGIRGWFWSTLCELGGVTCMILPRRNWVKRLVLWPLGLGLMTLGFFTMHIKISSEAQTKVASSVASNSDVNEIVSLIDSKKKSIKELDNIFQGTSESHITRRLSMLSEISKIQTEIENLNQKKSAAQKAALVQSPAKIAEAFSLGDIFQRLCLVYMSVAMGHFSLSILSKLLSKPSANDNTISINQIKLEG